MNITLFLIVCHNRIELVVPYATDLGVVFLMNKETLSPKMEVLIASTHASVIHGAVVEIGTRGCLSCPNAIFKHVMLF